MSGNNVLKWSLVFVIVLGSLCARTSAIAALASSSSDNVSSDSSKTQEWTQQTSTYIQRVYLDEQPKSTSEVPILDSDFHGEEEDFPYSQMDKSNSKSILGQEPLNRSKRGSGVVIRGPFYPYPRRGHPFAFTSGGHSFTLSSLSLLFIVSFFLALQQIAVLCKSW